MCSNRLKYTESSLCSVDDTNYKSYIHDLSHLQTHFNVKKLAAWFPLWCEHRFTSTSTSSFLTANTHLPLSLGGIVILQVWKCTCLVRKTFNENGNPPLLHTGDSPGCSTTSAIYRRCVPNPSMSTAQSTIFTESR